MKRPRRNEMHVIRTDVLLWALGGFAEPPAEAGRFRALPTGLAREVAEIARRRRAQDNEIVDLAERWNWSRNSLSALISYARTGHRRVPEYRNLPAAR